jgi:anti-sigma factor RsiW
MNTSHNSPVRPIDCDTTVRRLWDYLDEELVPTRYAEVEAHVRDCVHCAEHFSFAQAFLGAVSTSLQQPREDESLREQVLQKLKAEGFQVA